MRLAASVKARHLKLQKRLLFQNRAAAEALEEFYRTHGNPAEGAKMKRLGDINALSIMAFNGRTSLSNQQLRTVLAVNKELQRHDRHLFGNAEHFDQTYKPDEGWEELYRDFPQR
jgi:hypothetical protein